VRNDRDVEAAATALSRDLLNMKIFGRGGRAYTQSAPPPPPQKSNDEETARMSEMAHFAAAIGAQSAEMPSASNAREFLEALGSNRIIELTGDKYYLSEWDPYDEKDPFDEKPKRSRNRTGGAPRLANGVSWSDDVHDGGEIVLNGIKNMTIRRAVYGDRGGAAGANPEIIVDPRYAYVFKFINCENITIENVTMGHSAGGYCVGGVLRFESSSRINITGTNMYGSGTIGLELADVTDMKVANSSIYECTDQIMSVMGGRNISFENSVFRNNQPSIYSNLISVGGTQNLSFSNCEFKDNVGKMFTVANQKISVSRSKFSGNTDNKAIANSSNVSFADCVFE
jgi:hypothetical protein